MSSRYLSLVGRWEGIRDTSNLPAHEVFYVKVLVVLVIQPLMSSSCQLNEGKFLAVLVSA